MNEVVSIEVAGQVFWIDAQAYVVLKNYLKDIRLQLAADECAEEIYQDIELRIAELLYAFASNDRKAVSADQLNTVIEQIGPIESDFADDLPQRHSRLDPANRIIGGVCAGLSKRFGVPVFLFRLLFLVAAFAFGVGLALYLILWITMDTSKHVDATKPAQAGFWQGLQRIIFLPFSIVGALLAAVGNHFSKRRAGYLWLLKNLFAATLLILAATLIILLIEIAQARLFPPIINWGLGAAAIYLITLGLVVYFREHYSAPPIVRVKPVLKKLALIPALALSAAMAFSVWFQSEHHSEMSDHAFTLTAPQLTIVFNQTQPPAQFVGHVDYELKTHPGDQLKVSIEYEGLGRNSSSAEASAQTIEYYFAYSDNQLKLDKYWSLPDATLNRGQDVYVVVEIPQGVTVSSSWPLMISWHRGQPYYHTLYGQTRDHPATSYRYLSSGQFLHELDNINPDGVSSNERSALLALYCDTFFIGESWACNSNVVKPVTDNIRFDLAFEADAALIEDIRQLLQANRSLFLSGLKQMQQIVQQLAQTYPATSRLQGYIEQLIELKSAPPT
ncbi:MAG: hypothetical protein DHS20C11_36640 [Lysobacteraceae bacterium]|nr:MAG: hypothetical protein DHS20C11_36640 [Xanthomonadaceae bacterium]